MTAFEIVAGLVLASMGMTAMTILAALELGQRISMDDEQHEVEPTNVHPATFKRAA